MLGMMTQSGQFAHQSFFFDDNDKEEVFFAAQN